MKSYRDASTHQHHQIPRRQCNYHSAQIASKMSSLSLCLSLCPSQAFYSIDLARKQEDETPLWESFGASQKSLSTSSPHSQNQCTSSENQTGLSLPYNTMYIYIFKHMCVHTQM